MCTYIYMHIQYICDVYCIYIYCTYILGSSIIWGSSQLRSLLSKSKCSFTRKYMAWHFLKTIFNFTLSVCNSNLITLTMEYKLHLVIYTFTICKIRNISWNFPLLKYCRWQHQNRSFWSQTHRSLLLIFYRPSLCLIT